MRARWRQQQQEARNEKEAGEKEQEKVEEKDE